MLHTHLSMFFAFFGAGVAHFCAQAAELFAEASAQAHNRCRCIAKGSTFKIKLYTGFQLCDILFVEAGSGALAAGGSAVLANLNAFLVLSMFHSITFLQVKK